ncbi:MAG: murein biosynthesis integral membrane protein MurJ [Actinobacteria bacterium]|nr:murein biosynthesis integral membrane protein MurJ [Actinomycetota bacterium]
MTRSSGSGTVAAGILLSRMSGLVREVLVRGRLDIGVAGDAYATALRLPNLLQNLLGEGVLSASFIPVYSSLVDEDQRRAARLANTMAVFLIAVTTPLVIAGVLAADPLTRALAFGLTDARHDLTVDLVRIMTPGIGVLVLSAWSLGVLNSHRNFLLPYAAPVVWNLTQIGVVVAAGTGLVGRDLAIRVAWAVTAGAVLQFVIQIPALRRVNPHLGRGVAFRSTEFRDTLRRFGPVVLGRGSAQVSAFVDLGLATLLATGALAALGAAQVLHLLPISLFAMSVAAAELPEMSRLSTNTHDLRLRLSAALEQIMFFMAFTTVAYVVAGRFIVGAIFSLVPGSRIGQNEVLLIGLVVAGYSLGLVALGTSRMLQNTFYAVGDSATPARIAGVRYVVSAIVAVVLMFQMDRLFVYSGSVLGFEQLLSPLRPLSSAVRNADDLPLRLGALGLALGASVGAWVEVTLLRNRLTLVLGTDTVTQGRWRKLVLPTLAAAFVMLVVTPLSRDLPDLLRAAAVVLPAAVIYLGLAAFQRVEIATTLVGRLRAVTSKSNDSQPDAEMR